MKHYLLSCCFILILLLQVNSAKTQFVHDNYEVRITFNYKLSAVGKDTSLQISMDLEDKKRNETIHYGSANLSDVNVRNKDSLNEMLAKLYREVTKKHGVAPLRNYEGHVQKMVDEQAERLNTRQLHSLVFQSLCMFNTLAKGPARDIEECGNIPFTVMESFVNGLSSFSAEEDTYINIPGFKEYLKIQKQVQPQNEGIDYYLGALNNETAERLNMVEITKRLQAYFDETSGRWPQGGECGCCGNYSGPCFYWNKICLAHDYACQTCTPRWACFSGCVPSSCKGNTIAWYWWLL